MGQYADPRNVGLGFTLSHGKPDSESIDLAASAKKIDYPKPDGKLTFDKLTNVSFSATNHEEDQPVHLVLADPSNPNQALILPNVRRTRPAILSRRCL